MLYADPENKAFPIDTEAHVRAALDYLDKYYNNPSKGGVTAKYDKAKFKAVHAAILRRMKELGIHHDATGPLDAQSDPFLVRFSALGRLSSQPPVDIPVPPDLLARIKAIDPEPFIVAGLISRVDEVVNGVTYIKRYLDEIAAQIPAPQHSAHIDQQNPGQRRSNRSHMLAAAFSPDGRELWGNCWIPAFRADLIGEVKAGLAAGDAPAWSTEAFGRVEKDGDRVVPAKGVKLTSIDWVEPRREGVPGAGPKFQIHAQCAHCPNRGEYPPHSSQEERMNEEIRAYISAMGLPELKTLRPDLVTAIGEETAISAQSRAELETLKAARADLVAKVASLETEIAMTKAATLKAQVDAHKTELLSAIKQDKLRAIAADLLTGDTIAALDTNWPVVREKLAGLAPGMPIATGAAAEKGEAPEGLNY